MHCVYSDLIDRLIIYFVKKCNFMTLSLYNQKPKQEEVLSNYQGFSVSFSDKLQENNIFTFFQVQTSNKQAIELDYRTFQGET